ncbi:hypothetical protein ASG90_01345 [Nocardioides sp. Soil797]|nr:hypothetical protein ASG90_01345 [Nocardioides sp. Soil797]
MPAAERAPGWHAVQQLLQRQAGVISRRQVLACGLTPSDIARKLRRKDWVRTLDGVYLNHTGDPTWLQRAWAGVLFFAPAALSHSSAIRAVVGPRWRAHDEAAEIELVIPARRTVTRVPGYKVRRTRELGSILVDASPPRVRLERAVLDVAASAGTDLAAIGVLADACQSRRTTAARLLTGIGERPRLRRRKWLTSILEDVAEGTCSTLEHAHLTLVERPHGLPRGRRQRRDVIGQRPFFRDVDYEEQRLVVELDGRLFHDSAAQRDIDLERDLDVAADDRDSVRLGWGQCVQRPCSTARKLGRILQLRGWLGQPEPCGPGCAVGD